MLHRFARVLSPLNRAVAIRQICSKSELQIVPKETTYMVDTINDTNFITDDKKPSPLNVLSEEEDISHVAPYLKPSFNFAAYVNQSETLQELLKLGVNLHKIECKKNVAEYILGLDFERDIKRHVEFLHGLGLEVDEIGEYITKCPVIFKQDLDDLEVRINYLKAKKFTNEMILRIVSRNPAWLTFSTQEIDERLGYFQKQFKLSGNEVRLVATKKPGLITYDLWGVKLRTFVIKEEMCFTDEETKQILIKKPNLFVRNQHNLLKTFEYLNRTMNIPNEFIVENPEVLTCRPFRLRERHMFLEKLGRAQYDPKKPNYVSLMMLTSGTDVVFATEVAKSSIQAYNIFLKSL